MAKANFKAMGEVLSKKRKERGITQKRLSVRLGYSSSQLVSNFERGLAKPPLSSLKDLKDILEIDRKELIDLFWDLERRILIDAIAGKGRKRSKRRRR